ncbi:glycosyltransferase [Flavobacterium sp.]|uniref:glycosyltransferase n=1 Tax=Flavobacterium sp. TaxID=239 RepID=UPI00286DAB80|nr:glycosyltransferase [Flavobacterium sp.]
MAKRVKIGLLFYYDENWIAGSYYIINLIHSLNLLEDKQKPELIILSEKSDDFEKIQEINYPYIHYKLLNVELNLVYRAINKITRKFIFKRNIIRNVDTNVDLLFPSNGSLALSWIKKHLFWIPDFQELRLPQFFPNEDLVTRKKNRKIFSLSNGNVIFSSQDAQDDYNFFFPDNVTKNQVLHFNVFHPDFSELDEKVLLKYGLNKTNYFFSPNQFWKHKNHIVILEALVHLKKPNKLNFTVAFSGKEYDYRNPNYFEELQQYVKQNDIQDHVKFLGFIDRKEQLYIMKNALAVIQPSFFEGWSTVIEDAKRLNQNCIVSDLKVNQEQLGDKGFYFDPNDAGELAALLLKFNTEKIINPNFDYEEQSKLFGIKFMEIINSL